MAIHRDAETSSLNEDGRHFNGGNRRTGITAQTVVATLGKTILFIGLIILAIYALTDQLARKSCNNEDLNFAPFVEKNGILELTWDSLPTAIRSISNLAIIEHNHHCGSFNLSTLLPLRCDHLQLAYMPHSTFSFRHLPSCNTSNTTKLPPCFGLRWIVNRVDTYHGPFLDLDDMKKWFNSVTSPDYIGCMEKPGQRLNDDFRSAIQERNGTMRI